MKIHTIPNDIILTFLLLILGLAGFAIGIPALAAPIVLILPGYALTSALFPGRSDLDAVERILLSLGLNISIVPLAALTINALGFSLFGPNAPLLSILLLMTIFFTLVSFGRKARLTQSSHDLTFPRFNIIQVASVLLLIAAILIVSGIQEEKPTEFFLLDTDGTFNHQHMPVESKSGEVVIVVSNHCSKASYTVEVEMNGNLLEKHQFELMGEKKWMHEVKYNVPDQEAILKFILYRDQEPIRRLHLMQK